MSVTYLSRVDLKLTNILEKIDYLEWEGLDVPETLISERNRLEKMLQEGEMYDPEF